MHPIKQFLDDLIIPGCGIQISTLNHVVGVYPETPVSPLLTTHTDLYLLPGVDQNALHPVPHARNTKDSDISMKNAIVFDFDVRKDHPRISDKKLLEMMEGMLALLSCDPIVGSWRYAVCSGNGMHLWYIDDYAYPITGEQYKAGYTAACELFSPFLFTQPDTACKNPARMFRVPGSKNTKKGEKDVVMIQSQPGMISPIVKFVCTYTPKKKLDISTMLERIKRASMFDICRDLGYEVNQKGFLVMNGEATSIHLHPSGEFCTRFSGKPGSGDMVSLYRALYDKGFIEAVIDISQKVFHEEVALSEEQERKRNLEAFQRAQRLVTTYAPVLWNTELMNAQFPPIKRYGYVVLSGETKSGKSTVAFDIAVKNAKEGKRVLYITLEMTASQLRENIARSAANIEPMEERWRLEKGWYPQQKEKMYQETMQMLHGLTSLHIIGRDMGGVYTWKAIEERILGSVPWDLVVVDNLDKIDNLPHQTDFEKQKTVSNDILVFTNTYLIPVILIHHLRKPADEKRSVFRTVDALSGTGKISHDADMVVMVSRERTETGEYADSSTFVRVAETREFSPCIRKVWFHQGTFHDYDPVKHMKFDITDTNRM